MNTLQIMTGLALFAVATPSFADAPRVGEEQVITTQEKDNTATLKEAKMEKKKKLSKDRKNLKAEKREVKTSGSHADGTATE